MQWQRHVPPELKADPRPGGWLISKVCASKSVLLLQRRHPAPIQEDGMGSMITRSAATGDKSPNER